MAVWWAVVLARFPVRFSAPERHKGALLQEDATFPHRTLSHFYPEDARLNVVLFCADEL